MDPAAMLVIGAAWLVLNALRKAGSTSPTKPPPVPRRPLPDGGPAAAKPSGGPPARLRPDATRTRVAVPLDPTQREGARLEQLLRQLGASLDEAAAGGPMGRAPDRPLTEAEAEEDTESLEVAPEVQSLETDARRPSRPTVDQDDEAERVVAGRLRVADANLAPRTKADHRAFDQRIRQEAADKTAVASSRITRLRDAVVWREILGPPVSLRDDDDR